MKKNYKAPEIKVVSVRTHELLQSSPVKALGGNVFTKAPKASTGTVQARSRSWDDDWFEWDD
jgi:hypothetical protein